MTVAEGLSQTIQQDNEWFKLNGFQPVKNMQQLSELTRRDFQTVDDVHRKAKQNILSQLLGTAGKQSHLLRLVKGFMLKNNAVISKAAGLDDFNSRLYANYGRVVTVKDCKIIEEHLEYTNNPPIYAGNTLDSEYLGFLYLLTRQYPAIMTETGPISMKVILQSESPEEPIVWMKAHTNGRDNMPCTFGFLDNPNKIESFLVSYAYSVGVYD